MAQIRINRTKLSTIVWESIFENAAHIHADETQLLIKQASTLDILRTNAEYDTGSISTSAIWSIFSACHFFRPVKVAEVGTFIGKSTLSIAWAMDKHHNDQSCIYTCDFSNNINLDLSTKTKVKQYPKLSSTDMFNDIVQKNVSCDVIFLDGRLQNSDYKLLPKLIHPKTVFLLDDFEGIEKGVVNAMVLMQSLDKSHFLIYPPSNDLLNKQGLKDACSIGMIIPKSLISFTNQ